MMTDTQTTPAAMAELAREWLVARIVLVAGFIVAFAFVGYWSYTHRPEAVAAYADTDDTGAGVQSTNEGENFCRATFITGNAFGVLPNGVSASGGADKTDKPGRYTCHGSDPQSGQYTITADLVCHDLTRPDCLSLIEIKKADGTSLYKRADPVPADDAAPAGQPPADQSAAPSTDTSTIPADGSDGQTPPTDDGSAPPPPQ